jgi:uncharacterized protein
MHCHLYSTTPVDAGDLVRAARELGVSRMVMHGDVVAHGHHPSSEQVRSINDGTAETVRRYPDAFIPFCFVNPENQPSFSTAEIERRVRGEGFRGIKLLVSLNARDPRLDPVMEAARKLGVPLLHHSWHNALGRTENESTPADIADLAGRFPDVRIVMAHLGGARVRGVLEIAPHPNVLVDTSGSQPMGELLEYAVRNLGADRIVYGSDAPGRDFAPQLGRVWGARLRETDRRKILYRNAERILGV